MKIQFTDKRITEYKNGHFYAANDGTPIDLDPNIADDILAATHMLDGVPSPVFEMAESQADDTEEPETVESLAKKHSRPELEQLAKDAGLDGNTYTNKTELATAILAAKEEN